jgi:predicted nucleic acid-binding Zn ribbon protein
MSRAPRPLRRRAPRPLAETLGQLTAALQPRTLLAEVQRAWPEAAGAAVAAEARPVAERDGVLTVACRSSLWAHELQLMGPAVVDRLNAALGAARVRELRCTARPPREG